MLDLMAAVSRSVTFRRVWSAVGEYEAVVKEVCSRMLAGTPSCSTNAAVMLIN